MFCNTELSLLSCIENQTDKHRHMKKPFIPLSAGLLAMTLLTGCLNLELGGGSTTKPQSPTLGQQLIDLQKAKDTGAISDIDYQMQKTKLLNNK